MRDALIDGPLLVAPTVGTWRPAVGLGHPLTPGLVLGWIRRVGADVAVQAPAGVGGVVVDIAAAGTWVAAFDQLVEAGEGGLSSAPPPEAGGPGAGPEGAVAVTADTDGTVYLRPEPGAPAYAAEGSTVAANATVALVEVMKTFTPARAPISGEVVRVDVADGASVTAGQALLWVAR